MIEEADKVASLPEVTTDEHGRSFVNGVQCYLVFGPAAKAMPSCESLLSTGAEEPQSSSGSQSS